RVESGPIQIVRAAYRADERVRVVLHAQAAQGNRVVKSAAVVVLHPQIGVGRDRRRVHPVRQPVPVHVQRVQGGPAGGISNQVVEVRVAGGGQGQVGPVRHRL